MFEKDPNEVGVLWLKHGGKGEWMSGTIEGIGPVVVFPTNAKSNKAPTYRILKSRPKDERQSPRQASDVPGDEMRGNDTEFDF